MLLWWIYSPSRKCVFLVTSILQGNQPLLRRLSTLLAFVARLVLTDFFSLPWPPSPGPASLSDCISLYSPPSLLQAPWPFALPWTHQPHSCLRVFPCAVPSSIHFSACHFLRVVFPNHPSKLITIFCPETHSLYPILFFIALIFTWNCILFTKSFFLTFSYCNVSFLRVGTPQIPLCSCITKKNAWKSRHSVYISEWNNEFM